MHATRTAAGRQMFARGVPGRQTPTYNKCKRILNA
jgi:hypothetical protein